MKSDEIAFLILLFLISLFVLISAVRDARSGLRSVQSVLTEVVKDGGVILIFLIVFVFDEKPIFQVFALLILSAFYGYSALQLWRTAQNRTGKLYVRFLIQVGFAVGCALALLAFLTQIEQMVTSAVLIYGVAFLTKLLLQAVIKWEEQSQNSQKANAPNSSSSSQNSPPSVGQ